MRVTFAHTWIQMKGNLHTFHLKKTELKNNISTYIYMAPKIYKNGKMLYYIYMYIYIYIYINSKPKKYKYTKKNYTKV